MRNANWLRVAAIVAVLAALFVPVFASTASAGYTMPTFNHPLFERTWKNDDLAVLNGEAARSWRWGPALQVNVVKEPYKEAPGGFRTVQYFEKSRMEDNSWRVDSNDKWAVTNGLLAVEMATGLMQIGDNEYFDCGPANIPIAGDLNQTGVSTYATFYNDAQGANTYPWANEFSAFMEDGNNVYAVGLAKANPTNETFKVGGTPRTVVAQLGERRVLTFTPDNPEGWQIEWGNVGTHYYEWRYGPGGCMDKMNGGGNPPPDDGGNNPPPPPPPPSNGGEKVDLGKCADFASESMDSLARAMFDEVEAGQMVNDGERQSRGFHPIYNQGLYDDSDGMHGQYSWFFSYCIGSEVGGDFHQPKGNDGSFVFRHYEIEASSVLVIRTTGLHKDQFMDGESGRASINVKTNPFGKVWLVAQDGTLQCNEPNDCRASKDGDILIQVPDDGIIALYVESYGPPDTLEVRYTQGPDNRWDGINRVDGAKYKW